ncbi:MAG: RDD family protein [Deltaproteobacteria bacterium]|nr:RDD family protein [Deltaproteobacteria bacterium]
MSATRAPLTAHALRRAEHAGLGREIKTPEGIPIHFTLARAGDRAAAFAIDLVIQIAALMLVAVVAGLALGREAEASWLTPVILILSFLLVNFYFAFFEIRWQGATPGKRRVGLRVIDARGGQLETTAVLARNLVRELEVWTPARFLVAGGVMWPGAPGWAVVLASAWTFVFLFMPLFNKDRLRVGDLIAGTRVVMQPRVVLLPDLVTVVAPAQVAAVAGPAVAGARAYVFTDAQLAVYGIYELQVLEGVLRGQADRAHQVAVQTVAEKIRAKIGYDQPVTDDEAFLRDFYAALRGHLEQKMLFGHRREDKHAR